MKTASEELYTAHTQKAVKLLENKRRRVSSSSNALIDAFEAYSLLAIAKEQQFAAHHHLIALEAFSKGLNRNESQAGLISHANFTGLNVLTEAIAKWLNPTSSLGEKALFQKGTLFLLIFALGSLELAKGVLKAEPLVFSNELLLRLLSSSSMATLKIKGLCNTLTKNEQKAEKAATALEGLLLLICLAAFSKDEIPEDFFEALKDRLLLGIQEAKKIAEELRTENAFFLSSLGGLEMAIEKSRYEMVPELIDSLLKRTGGSFEELKRDAAEIKQIAFSINEAFKVGRLSKPSLLHLVG